MTLTIDVIDVDESEIDVRAINEQDLRNMNDWRLYNLINLANLPINNIFIETNSVMITLRDILYFRSVIPAIIYQSKNTVSLSLDFIKPALLEKRHVQIPASQNINIQAIIISKNKDIAQEVLTIMGIATYTSMAKYLERMLFGNIEYIFLVDKFKEYTDIKKIFVSLVNMYLRNSVPYVMPDLYEYKLVSYNYSAIDKLYIEFNKALELPTDFIHSGIIKANIIQNGSGRAFLDYLSNGLKGKIFKEYIIVEKDSNTIKAHNLKIFSRKNMKQIVLLRYLRIIKEKMSTAIYNKVKDLKTPEAVLEALSKTEQNILHSTYKILVEQWKLVRNNKCEHIIALKSEDYGKIIPFVSNLTQTDSLIPCNTCKVPFICPHLLAYYRIEEKTSEAIYKTLQEFISNDTSIKDKFSYYCKICGAIIMNVMKDNEEQLDSSKNEERNSIWGYVNRLLSLLTFKIIVSIKKIANDSTTILLKNIERYVEIFKLKVKSHDYEEMRKAVTVVFVAAYVFDIIVRSNGNIEYKGESGKSPNKLVQLLLAQATSSNYKTFASLNISTDKVIVMFKDAYNLMKGLSYVESNDFTSDMLTAILNDELYKFAYRLAMLEGVISDNDSDAIENFKIVYGMSFKDLVKQTRLIKQGKLESAKIIVPRPFMPNVKNTSSIALAYRNIIDYNSGKDHKTDLMKLRANETGIRFLVISSPILSPDTYYHYYWSDTKLKNDDIGRVYDINGKKHNWKNGKCSTCGIEYAKRLNYSKENYEKINSRLQYINSFKSVFAFFENNCPVSKNNDHEYDKTEICKLCKISRQSFYDILYENKHIEDDYYNKYYSIYKSKSEQAKKDLLVGYNSKNIEYSIEKTYVPDDVIVTTDGEMLGYTETLEYDYKIISEYFDKYQDFAANRVKGMIIDFISKYNETSEGKFIKYSDYVNNVAHYTAKELQTILFSIVKKYKSQQILAGIITANMLYSKPKVFNVSLLYNSYDNSGKEYEDIDIEEAEPEVTEDLPNLLPSGEN